LASGPAVFVGLISYPLYLWHWPLLVFAGMLDRSDYHLSPHRFSALRAATVVLAFVLSWATYKCWETPMRFSPRLTSAHRVRLLLASMAGAALLGILSLRVIAPRLNSTAVREMAIAMGQMRHCENWKMSPFAVHEIPSRGKNATLLVGDSFMEHYESRIEAAIQADPRRATAVFATSGLCPPLPGMNPDQPGFRCPAFYDFWTRLASQPRFTTVAISSLWWLYDFDTLRGSGIPVQNSVVPQTYRGRRPTAHDFDEAWSGLETTVRSLVNSGKRVVILAPSPNDAGLNPQNGISRIHTPAVWRLPPLRRAVVERVQVESNKKLIAIARDSGAEIIWPMDYLCRADKCPALDADGSPIYVDDGHIRPSEAAKLASFVDDLVRP
jgi:hypothetical protein